MSLCNKGMRALLITREQDNGHSPMLRRQDEETRRCPCVILEHVQL